MAADILLWAYVAAGTALLTLAVMCVRRWRDGHIATKAEIEDDISADLDPDADD